MMKKLLLLAVIPFVVSCNRQEKTELENLKYNEKITFPENLEKDFSIIIPLKGIYKAKDITQFRLFGVALTDYSRKFKNEGAEYANSLNIVVDDYDKNNYYGFELELYNEKLSDKFLDLLKKKYGNPVKKYEYENDPNIDLVYLWQNKSSNQIIYFNKHNEGGHSSANGETVLSETKMVIIKDGLSAKPDETDPRNTPEKIKALLAENPHAFDLIEIFKNQIPE